MAGPHQIGNAALVVIAGILLLMTLAVSGSIVGPLVFALFITTLVHPLKQSLTTILPRHLALAISFMTVVVVLLGFGWLIAWAFGQVGRWALADAVQLQQFYGKIRLWLEDHGIVTAALWAENFSVSWIFRTVQMISGRVNSTFSFWLVSLVYVLLLLIEIECLKNNSMRLQNKNVARVLLEGSRQTAIKVRRYMFIRTAMSVSTGLLIWAFASLIGLPLAKEWGFIAFTLNYIPFVGPFVATLLPTIFALVQFGTWQSVLLIFVGLNVIQIVGGSFIEPRLSGNALSMSPTLVLFSIFLWGGLWGVFGAFIGVPISIALLTYCAQHPSSAWIGAMFGSSVKDMPRVEEKTEF